MWLAGKRYRSCPERKPRQLTPILVFRDTILLTEYDFQLHIELEILENTLLALLDIGASKSYLEDRLARYLTHQKQPKKIEPTSARLANDSTVQVPDSYSVPM